MMTKTNVVAIETVVPSNEFWEDELEMGLEPIRAKMQEDGYVQDWVDRRTGRQADILCDAIGLNADGLPRRKKQYLRDAGDALRPYILVEWFARYKAKVAVIDFARGVLTEEYLKLCQKDEDGENYDTKALLFAIFKRKWSDLKLVYHLDKIHKTGFARMKLLNTARKPQQTLKEFLQTKSIKAVLAEFDKARGDGLSSDLKDIISDDGRHLVFVRRANRPDHLVRKTGGIIHGYKSEWIILDFEEGAKRVNISSLSVKVPLEIANRLAAGYFGKPCEYENEREITYAKQLERLLDQIRKAKDGGILLVEVVAVNSPLEGAPKIKISDPASGSIDVAVGHFEKVVGKFLSDIEHLESVKVLFHKKRVSLIFEKVEESDGEYVVRYSDHRLNARERREFEKLMKDTHGITVLSTEKRFK